MVEIKRSLLRKGPAFRRKKGVFFLWGSWVRREYTWLGRTAFHEKADNQWLTSEGRQQSDDHTNIHNGIVELNYVSIVFG